jgi:3-deoxy-manno-octulosonate cytidylyltransferase (CMP-KDO synthetase)
VNSFAVVIPARMESTRLPGKVMKYIDGMTMIEQVVKRVAMVVSTEDIYIATDNNEIADHSDKLKIKSILTSKSHQNGTSRVAEAAINLDYDYIVIVQADEIFLVPDQLNSLLEKIRNDQDRTTYNLVAEINQKDLNDYSVVKSLLNPSLRIIFLSRGNPLINNDLSNKKFLKKNTGIFAFPKEVLMQLQELPDTPIQKMESIEQLKMIEYLIPIIGIPTNYSYPSINEEKDLDNYNAIMKTDKLQQDILKSIQ